MFGVQGFSVDSFSNQGIVFLVAQTLIANFTQETPAIKITPASAEITSIFKQASDSRRVANNRSDMSANFTQTSTQTVASNSSANTFSI